MIMNQSLGMTYEEIADTWEQWNKSGPLHDNFFIDIGVDICRTKDPEDNSKFLLADVRDKVVQDVDETEGTGTWTCQEAVALHVSAPTITAAHLFRLQSADAARRIAVEKALPKDPHGRPKKLKLEAHMPLEPFLEDLRQATYFSFLAAFIQGLHLIAAASAKYEWNIDFAGLIQLWRGGCIIQSDGIADLLENAYRDGSHSKTDLLEHSSITNELVDSYSAIKNVVLKCTEADCYIPSISASLEYFKYSSSTELPTQFMEAELDFFGGHMFDLKSAEPGKPVTGKSIHNTLLMNILT
jgi:6-phosphogluconate dehydrogenase